MTERYARTNLERFPVGGGKELLVHPYRGSAGVLAQHQLHLLEQCKPWRTLAEHGAVIGLSPEDAAARLAPLVASGWLVAESKLRADLTSTPSLGPVTHDRLARLAIPTRDRPAALEACIESYVDGARKFDRRLAVTVCDDSTDPVARDALRARLRALAIRLEISIAYAGVEEKQRFAATLAKRASVRPELLAFALFGDGFAMPTYGANRNAIQLSTIGERVLCADDDTRCRLIVPAVEPGLGIARGRDFDWWWFADRDEVLRQPFVDADLFAAHEQLLGNDVADCIAAHGGPDNVALEPDAMFPERVSLHGGRVRVTLNGLIGDSGTVFPSWLLYARGESLERMAQTRADFQRAMTTREMLRVTRRAAITPPGFLMSTVIGLDHRDLMPPFFPVGRGEDGIYARVLQACTGSWLVGHLPIATLHAADHTRSIVEVLGPKKLTIHEMMMALFGSPAVRPILDPVASMRGVGAELRELSALPAAAFRAAIQRLVATNYANPLARAESRLADAPFHARWMRDELRRRWFAQHDELIAGLAEPLDDATRVDMQRVLAQYGELLERWPDIVAATRELRADGVMLAS